MKSIIRIFLVLLITTNYIYAQGVILDPGFGTGGVAFGPFSNVMSIGRALALQPDGKIVVTGSILVSGGDMKAFVMRHNPDGTFIALSHRHT